MSESDTIWQRYKLQGDQDAREQLILRYAYLAKYVVDRMCICPSGAVGYEDLIGYGIVGLIEAVEKFDLSREIKFQTYAISRIRGAVLDALKSVDWVPRSIRESAQKLSKVRAQLESAMGRTPTDGELAEAMGIGIDDISQVILVAGQSAMLSLEEILLCGDEGGISRGLDGGSSAELDPLIAAEMAERSKILAEAIGNLPERERLVISLYYKDGLTLKEIAEVLGFTESRACQVHSKAVIRLHGKLAGFADLMLAAA